MYSNEPNTYYHILLDI